MSEQARYSEATPHGAPLVERVGDGLVRVTFLWQEPPGRPPVERVYLDANSMTDHHTPHLTRMRRVADTPLWYWWAVVRDDWRASYCFIPVAAETVDRLDPPTAGATDGGRRRRWLGLLEHTIVDPLNPHRAGRGATHSIAAMPNAPAQSRWEDESGLPFRTTELNWQSALLGVDRSVWVTEVGHPDGGSSGRSSFCSTAIAGRE